MRPLLICYHPDFGRFYNFQRQTKLDSVAGNLGMDAVFPLGGWFKAWRDKDVRGKPSYELADFDALTRHRQVILCGYSDGAGLANYLASYRSERVIAVVSYAGRMQRSRISTSHKYPVLDIWNERDRRLNSTHHHRMVAEYRMHSHPISRVVLPNGKNHFHGWDAEVNPTVEKFIRSAM